MEWAAVWHLLRGWGWQVPFLCSEVPVMTERLVGCLAETLD